MKTMITDTFTKKVMKMPTDAESGTRIGGNASRRRIEPPSTIEGNIALTISTKNVKRRIPIRRKIA